MRDKTTMKRLLIILHSSQMRRVSETEALAALPPELTQVPRQVIEIDTAPFAVDIDSGGWEASAIYLKTKAKEIREAADSKAITDTHYYGIAEIPHIISLGSL